MKTRTIAGDIRRIRSLMRLGPEIGSCVIRRGDYDELLKLFDAIETKAKRMQDALKPILGVEWVEKRYNYCSGTVPTKDLVQVVREAQSIYNGGEK